MNKQLREIPLNPTELNTLRSIAALCPYYDGIAVYDARSILMEYHVSFVENDCETTAFIAPTIKGKKRLKSIEVTPVFAIYPNPFADELVINYALDEKKNGRIEIIDLLGRTVINKQLSNANQHYLKTKSLKSGIYLYKLYLNGEVIEQGKIVKN